jgi:hypothetical protein
VISTGDGNGYKHPTEDCLIRLHEAGLQKVYWTERGAGASPDAAFDVVAGDIRIEVSPGANSYTVSHEGATPDKYKTKASASTSNPGTQPPATPEAKYAWSKRSKLYHDASCPDVKRILEENLAEGNTPPSGKNPAACVKGDH